MMKSPTIEHISIRGLVQGIGFRPYVVKIARTLDLNGEVFNDNQGVTIYVKGPPEKIDQLVSAFHDSPLPLAQIDTIDRQPMSIEHVAHFGNTFCITASKYGLGQTTISPDINICAACLEDTLSPESGRYRYPFTNCSYCGPRYSIIQKLPYDRIHTSMQHFDMCPSCQTEYQSIHHRRFHAQPNACYHCGPSVSLQRGDQKPIMLESLTHLDEIDAACTLIQRGEIVAIKGIGGYYLACDATNEKTVARLRQRKQRYGKPFAMMGKDIKMIERYCKISEIAQEHLMSVQAPIVIMPLKQRHHLADSVVLGLKQLGFMLPYTPLHHLLFKRMKCPMVMTSGNISHEPQCTEDATALTTLVDVADYFLLNNREIVNRIDDSVILVRNEEALMIRRARGYAPTRIPLPKKFMPSPDILAVGGELKNTFAFVKDQYLILSEHIGDLKQALVYDDYRKKITFYQDIYQLQPKIIATDLHPQYLSSQLAYDHNPIEHRPIQHHHAHIASCLCDNHFPADCGSVIGIVLDGMGLGETPQSPHSTPEETLYWGGEFMLANYANYTRLATFKPLPLLGGDKAAYQPWRSLYVHLVKCLGWNKLKVDYGHLAIIQKLQQKNTPTLDKALHHAKISPSASSCGRLFDAVAAALMMHFEETDYEGQAAVALENLFDASVLKEPTALAYPFNIPRLNHNGIPYIEPTAMWEALLGDLILSTPSSIIASRFHRGLSLAICKMAESLCSEHTTDIVALSGGVWQNSILTELVTYQLRQAGITVLQHRNIPCHDGGLSVGQALIACRQYSQTSA